MIEAEAREAAAREWAQRVKHRFTNVAEVFFTDKLAHERRGKRAERDFAPSSFRHGGASDWRDRPGRCVGDGQRQEAPCAGNGQSVVTLAGRFFTWVIDQQVYGLTTSPCSGLTKKKIVGETIPRNRRLNDAECSLLAATERMSPGRPSLSHAPAQGAAAQRVREVVMAGGSRRPHHRPRVENEGQGR